MTDPSLRRLQEQGTSRHFLLSKTDTRSLDGHPCPELAASEIGAAFNQRFPGIRAETAFVEAAAAAMTSTEAFSAMAIRCDRPQTGLDMDSGPWGVADWMVVAETASDFTFGAGSLWGLMRSDVIAVCCPDTAAEDLLEQARHLQKKVRQRLKKTVSVGLAAYPCISYRQADVFANAIKALDHAAFFGPESAVIFDAVSLNISGDHHYDLGEFEQAIAEFKRALLLDPDNVNVHNSLGVCYGILGEHGKAKTAFTRAVELDPSEYMSVYNLGMIHLLEGERRLAMDKFVAADRIEAGVLEIVFQIGKLHLDMGSPEEAKPYLEAASGLNPDSGQVYRCLGECCSALGDEAEAISAYQRAVRTNPNDAASLSALGCLLDNNGENPEIALMFCRESVGLAPENALFRNRLGTLYLKHDQLENALREFRKAELLGYDSSEGIQAAREKLSAHR